MTIEEKVMELYNKFDHDIAVHNIVALVEEACEKQRQLCSEIYRKVAFAKEDWYDSEIERAIKKTPELTWED